MELTNEYLIIIDEKTSSAMYTLCISNQRFNELLTTDTLNIKKGKISNNKIECKYSIKMGNVKDKKQNFFYIKINFIGNEDKLDNYDRLLNHIKFILDKHGANVETLRDDLSFYYSQLAYSKIHKIENLMRKFITYFMITNLGKNWINESSPKQIKEVLDKSKRKDYMDELQKLDFIHLGELLFKSFQEKDISKLFEIVKSSNKTEYINFEELESFIPQSNWDKYFKDLVNCDDKFLKERWEKLYDLRNKIAHTSSFLKSDYINIKSLTSDVEEKLNKAFDSIDKIEMDIEDKEQLSENIAVNINEDIGKFLKEWNEYEKTIRSIYKIEDGEKSKFLEISKRMLKKDFDEQTLDEIYSLSNYRNNLVHNIDIDNKDDILKNIDKIKNILNSTWKIQVLKAFHSLGGEATLDEIYEYIKKSTQKELTVSGESSIRKAIYFHSSDVDLFQGKEDLFQRIDKGRWKLREN